MATFGTLPTELRRRILEYVIEPGPVSSQCVLGFRNPSSEAGPPTIYLSLPLKALRALYRSNPAGVGRGRFVRPQQLRCVSWIWKLDVEDVWDKTIVTVGTWLSFLANRPSHLLKSIERITFRHWTDGMYWEDLANRNRVFSRIWSILATWRSDLTLFQAIAGTHLPNEATYEFTVASSPRITYTVRNGLERRKTDELMERIDLRIADAFSRFDEAEGETPARLIFDDEDDVDWDDLRDDRAFPNV